MILFFRVFIPPHCLNFTFKKRNSDIFLSVSAEILQLHSAGHTHVPAERAERWRGYAAPAELSGVRAQT